MARIKQAWKRLCWEASDLWRDLTDFRTIEQRAEDRAYWTARWDAVFRRETKRVTGSEEPTLPILPEAWFDG